MNLRLCLVGCGGFSRLCHGPAQRRYAASRTDTELTACCDADAARAREFAGQFGYARHYTDPRVMLAKEKPDAVVLAVPPAATCEAACAILERGVPLLLEKPPGLDPGELERLITAAERGRAKAQVAFNRRYMPVIRQAFAILGADLPPESVGRIDYDLVRCDRWDADFSTTAIHAVDAACFLARSPIRSAQLRFQRLPAGGRGATNVFLEAETVAGTRLAINIQPVTGRNAEAIRIHSIGRSLWLKVPASPLSSEPGTLEYWRDAARVQAFSDDGTDMIERMGILGELAAFLAAVRADACPTPGLAECRPQVRLMDAIRRNHPGPLSFEAT